jgi:hypothetical protein
MYPDKFPFPVCDQPTADLFLAYIDGRVQNPHRRVALYFAIADDDFKSAGVPHNTPMIHPIEIVAAGAEGDSQSEACLLLGFAIGENNTFFAIFFRKTAISGTESPLKSALMGLRYIGPIIPANPAAAGKPAPVKSFFS